ncbi:plasmid recombination protein [Lachnospiraceae bacterium C1.1]|nr:plasmid recombination protein [Lachnospiraceae bacterium C1.1]
MATTLSFVVGKGSLTHNNREFVAENVDRDRIKLDEFYNKEPLKDAYRKLFGLAVDEYNASQKRKDRQINDYITKIKNSKNHEKVFYENVVQIGRMTDFGVVDENGKLTENAIKAKEVLEEYVRTFQERNPNLYLFNAVLHMDEATPHLHLDYIPIAHGYKTGMKTRNSLTKALQEMGIPKAISKMENETVYWQRRERDYLTELCQEKGIEIEVLGIDRDDYTIPEYKEAMKAKNEAEAEIEILKAEKFEIIQYVEAANDQILCADAEMSEKEDQLREIEDKIVAAEKQCISSKRKIQEIAYAGKAVEEYLSDIKDEAVGYKAFLSGDEMVKLPKKSYEKLLSISKSVGTLKNVIRNDEAELSMAKEKISKLEGTVKKLKDSVNIMKAFIEESGPINAFKEFLQPKSLVKELREIRECKRKIAERENESTRNFGKTHRIDVEL